MSTQSQLVRVLSHTGPVLLDFDGPVCAVFARHRASDVAAELRSVLSGFGVNLPDTVRCERDPLAVLNQTAGLGWQEPMLAVERTLRAAELRAVQGAVPTPYAREVIVAARQAERQVTIVSNNSEAAILAYLHRHRLTKHINVVAGRLPGEPERMKPNPDSILRAARALGVESSTCLLIGDSRADVRAAQTAGVPIVGFANKPHKLEMFREAQVDAVVTSMAEIALALLD